MKQPHPTKRKRGRPPGQAFAVSTAAMFCAIGAYLEQRKEEGWPERKISNEKLADILTDLARKLQLPGHETLLDARTAFARAIAMTRDGAERVSRQRTEFADRKSQFAHRKS